MPKLPGDSECTIADLKDKAAEFVHERDWEQFHSPKNLSMAMTIEAAELMELFQWVGTDGGIQVLKGKRKEVEAELADITLYLLEFCNLYSIDLSEAVRKKLELNARKYPAKLVKGKSAKYTEYAKTSRIAKART